MAINYRVRKAKEKYHMQSFYEVTITKEEFTVQFNVEKYTEAKLVDGKPKLGLDLSKENTPRMNKGLNKK